MTKKQVVDELETILKQAKLSQRAGKYEAMERFEWFNTVGRARLIAVIERLKERRDGGVGAAKYVWNGPELDPKRHATEPPKWWHNTVEAVEVPEQTDYFEPKEGGFAVGFDGSLMYSKGETAQEQKGWSDVSKQSVITPEEYGQMLAYKVSKKQTGLYNVVLAGKIKPYWLQGKKPGEIAVLIGEKTESLVRQYCICLERAKAQNPSPA